MTPKVSIIIPMFNSLFYIKRCLLSCVKQTFSNIEIIVVDDASTDNGLSVARKFASNFNNIKVFTLPENSGTAAARNFGIAKACGEYIAFLDSDDWLTLDSVEARVNILDHFKNVGIVSGYAYVVRKGEKYVTEIDKLRWRHGKLVVSGTGMIRADILRQHKKFDSRCVLSEDREFWGRLIMIEKIKAVKILRPIAFYFINDKSKVSRASEELRTKDSELTLKILQNKDASEIYLSDPIAFVLHRGEPCVY